LYGNNEVEFESFIAEEEIEDSEIQLVKKVYFNNVVSREIYLNLQEDEVEFADENFKRIYYELIHQLNQNKKITVDAFINHSNSEIANLVTNILMDDEKYALSNWDKKNIQVKSKESVLSKLVLDVIYNLRRVLIEKKIEWLVAHKESEEDILETITNYNSLKMRLCERLARVVLR